jgi:hypothetical protein
MNESTPTTRWSRVARAAPAELYAAYWFPISAAARRLGRGEADTLDPTQAR